MGWRENHQGREASPNQRHPTTCSGIQRHPMASNSIQQHPTTSFNSRRHLATSSHTQWQPRTYCGRLNGGIGSVGFASCSIFLVINSFHSSDRLALNFLFTFGLSHNCTNGVLCCVLHRNVYASLHKPVGWTQAQLHEKLGKCNDERMEIMRRVPRWVRGWATGSTLLMGGYPSKVSKHQQSGAVGNGPGKISSSISSIICEGSA